MERKLDTQAIRTPRLELIALTPSFVEALVAGDLATAGAELGIRVGPWLASDPSHVIQLHLAGLAGQSVGYEGFGWLVVLSGGRRARRAIGSVGFHGPPDARGRLELGCRIHPAHRGQGYAAEASTALLDWAATRFGITRFLVAVPARQEPWDLVPLEISNRGSATPGGPIEGLAELIELEPRS